MHTTETAIIILNYKSWRETLEEAQLVHDLFNLEWEQIIIVDNHSPNDSVDHLRKKAIGNYILLESYENNGYASGNNIGLRYAFKKKFKYAWVLNNDIDIIDKSILMGMINVLENNVKIGVISPDILSPEGHLYNRYSKRPTFLDNSVGLFNYLANGRKVQDLGGYAYVYRPQGCCMLIRLDSLHEIDYMDENTFLYCEEAILAERLLKKDLYCACYLKGNVVHNHSTTVKASINKIRVVKIKLNSYNYYLQNYMEYGLLKRLVCLAFNAMKNIVLD